MRNKSQQFNRRAYLKTTGVATAGMIGLAGCTGDGDPDGEDADGDGDTEDGDSAFGTLSTSITDQPNDIDDFEQLIVTIDGIWIKPASAEDGDEEAPEDDGDDETDDPETNDDGGDENNGDEEEDNDENGDDEQGEDDVDDGEDVDQGEGRRYIEFDEPQTADLVDLQGDNTALIDETDVEVGDYLFLQLDVSNTEGILVEDGSEADVETPGNAPLQFQQNFEIRADERTRFIADFAPMRQGRGSYIIRPVAAGTRVLYGDEEYTADDDETDDGGNETADGSDDPGNETEDEPNGSDDDQPNGPPEDD